MSVVLVVLGGALIGMACIGPLVLPRPISVHDWALIALTTAIGLAVVMTGVVHG
jgi:hypothetical protein